MHDRDASGFDHEEEQNKNKQGGTQRIRVLNDKFRRTGLWGQQLITLGIQEMGLLAVIEIRQLVASFDAFSEDNDPYDEHDFGCVIYRNEKVFWKIDYYDATLSAGSPDPADPIVTTRVLTIMLAQEY